VLSKLSADCHGDGEGRQSNVKNERLHEPLGLADWIPPACPRHSIVVPTLPNGKGRGPEEDAATHERAVRVMLG
jgi:hypothetical protein